MKKKVSVAMTIIFFSLSILLMLFNWGLKNGSDSVIVKKTEILLLEKKYNREPTIENLYSLCDKLQLSREYNKIQTYYPILLKSEDLYNVLERLTNDTIEQDECFDLFLINYLISTTQTDGFDAKKFVDDMRIHRVDNFYDKLFLYATIQFKDDGEALILFDSKLNLLSDYLSNEEEVHISTIHSKIASEGQS